MSDVQVKTASATFTRPADTTAYASGDLVADSTTAGSVTPLEVSFGGQGGKRSTAISQIRLTKSDTGTTNASFRVHLYAATPTPSNGDNASWLTDEMANYLGSVDVTIGKVFTEGAFGTAAPSSPVDIPAVLTSGKVYALIEARAAYTPASAEVFVLHVVGYEA